MLRYVSRFSSLVRSLLTTLLVATAVLTIYTSHFSVTTHAKAHLPAAVNVAPNAADLKPGVIYQVMLDRFFDGDSTNNDPVGDTGLYDSTKSNWKLYWGGDLAGLTKKIPYIAGMGVTAVWISPPVENIHQPAYTAGSSAPNAGYHGYWTRDFYRIDPHLGTWSDFDTLVSTAHNSGIKIVIDFPANGSNPNDTGEYGSLYNNGTFEAAYNNDPNGWFHHNPTISDYNNLYQDEYYSLSDIADLAQENSSVDSYLKGAMTQFLNHGVDGVRVDAAKHVPGATGGWERTLSDTVEAQGPHYMVGEWYLSSVSDPTYASAVEFANRSGINLLNFPINTALRNVYGSGNSASEIDSALSKEKSDLLWPNDQANFVDSHDMTRFLTLNNNNNRLHEALATTLTIPGIPIVYYGTEQYLHNDTSGGGDPYNRPQMINFDTTTTAYNEIKTLAALRQSNPALAYGTYQQRQINGDVYIYERQFGNNVVLVAINKGTSASTITNLNTALPDGSYNDYLGTLLHGGTSYYGQKWSGDQLCAGCKSGFGLAVYSGRELRARYRQRWPKFE